MSKEALAEYLRLEEELLQKRASESVTEAEDDELRERMHESWLHMSKDERAEVVAHARDLLKDLKVIGLEGVPSERLVGLVTPIFRADQVSLDFSYDPNRVPPTLLYPSKASTATSGPQHTTWLVETEQANADSSDSVILYVSDPLLTLLKAEIYSAGLKPVGTTPAKFQVLSPESAARRVSRWLARLSDLLKEELARDDPREDRVRPIARAIMDCLPVSQVKPSRELDYLFLAADIVSDLGSAVSTLSRAAIGDEQTAARRERARESYARRSTQPRRLGWAVPVHV